MRLIRALRYTTPVSVAFVGAGGKSTAIFQAARELLFSTQGDTQNQTVLVTTTTHFGTWQESLADRVYCIRTTEDIHNLEKQVPIGVVLVHGEHTNDRLGRLEPKLLEEVNRLANEHNLPLLIEADGAHTRPLKAPAEHEPSIPEFTQLIVVVAGLSGLSKPLNREWVHRPEQFASLTGLRLGEIISADALEKELLDKAGGLKNIPAEARNIVLLNQADTPELKSQAKTMGEKLVGSYKSCIISSLSIEMDRHLPSGDQSTGENTRIHAVIERTGGIILAAGSSSRFGVPKQKLLWRGEPLVRHVVRSAINAGLSPIVVVVGAFADEVKEIIKDLPVRVVNNIHWREGISASIKEGLRALKNEVGGVVFLQADQPQIPPDLIKSMVEAHQLSINPIIAPQIDGQRGNPVLFDVDTFPQLLAINGDIGGRALFSQYQVQGVVWHDPKLLLDIDSPEDYQRFLRAYPDGEVQA